MISPQDIRDRARKLWESGRALRGWLGAEALFPYSMPVGRPSAQERFDRFAELRSQVDALEHESRAVTGSGYTLTFSEAVHQKLGRLRFPERVSFETVHDLATFIGEGENLRRFIRITQFIRAEEPRLESWLALRPFRALECDAELPRLLAVAIHFARYPRPMCFARQLGVPGVDSKFIEQNRGTLTEWLDLLLPAEQIDQTIRGVVDGAFERRFGLRVEEPVIRFRWLDPERALAGAIVDATVPVSQLAAYAPACERVIVTENKVNFLTLPACPGTLSLFGGGYGLGLLAGVAWLAAQPLYYWGDLDTHGFAILSRLRGSWPQVRSLLMDHAARAS